MPKGRLWVMGDNRAQQRGLAASTRTSPAVARSPADDVVGKVWAIVWPFGRAHLLYGPATFENPQLRATDH